MFHKFDFSMFSLKNTVNPLYNDIRYNSKICYNVNSVCTKNQRIVYYFSDSHMLFFRKTYVFDICKNRLAEAILTNTQNVWFIKTLFKSIQYSCFRRVDIKFLYNSKFDLTAKSLVTNSVLMTRAHWTMLKNTNDIIFIQVWRKMVRFYIFDKHPYILCWLE